LRRRTSVVCRRMGEFPEVSQSSSVHAEATVVGESANSQAADATPAASGLFCVSSRIKLPANEPILQTRTGHSASSLGCEGALNEMKFIVICLYLKSKLLSQIAAITFEQSDYFCTKVQHIADYLRTLSTAQTTAEVLQLNSEAC